MIASLLDWYSYPDRCAEDAKELVTLLPQIYVEAWDGGFGENPSIS